MRVGWVSVDMWIIIKWKQAMNRAHGIIVGATGGKTVQKLESSCKPCKPT